MRVDPTATARRLAAVAGFAIPFAFVAYLGLRGGGYDTVVRDQAGLVAWGLVLVGALTGRFTLGQLRGAGLWVLGFLLAFAVWTALALIWTESAERTFEEMARVACYLGVLCLALALHRRGDPGPTLDAVAAAIGVIGAVALLSHLHSHWFPTDELTAAQLGGQARLNYPLNYWNGLAALLAIGIPLLLAVTVQPRRRLVQALAAAAVPVLALAIYFTFSRTGLIAVAAALITFLALAPRGATFLRLAPAAAGSAVLIAIATTRDALEAAPTTAAAQGEGASLLVIVIVVCLGVVGLRLALSRAEERGLVPRSPISRRTALRTLIAAAAAAVVVAVLAGAPARVADQWEQFKQPASPTLTGGSARFASTSGSGRYQYWRSSLDALASAPATGIGPGTFEYWWSREGTIGGGFVKQAHSLYFETLAELGILGLLLLAGLIAVVIAAGVRLARRANNLNRTALAGLLASTVAFIVAAGSDWVWEMPVIPVAFLLIAAAIVCARPEPATADGPSEPEAPVRPGVRMATVIIAVAAVVVISISMAGAELLRQSQEAGRRGDFSLAAEKARAADSIEPYAATPKLQEALALQAEGDLEPAALRAQEATEREPTNWKTWYALFTIDRDRGAMEAADRAYERARSLNPRSSIFPQAPPPAG